MFQASVVEQETGYMENHLHGLKYFACFFKYITKNLGTTQLSLQRALFPESKMTRT
jgi:hypothetical protein